jgi:hypothetical protein
MKNISQWLVMAVIIISIGIRLTVYGNLKLSVATRDTTSYITSSRVDLLSWKAFTSFRPYTTNLVYKIFTPLDGYQIRAISDGDSGTVKRKIDRGAENIVVLHTVMSIIGWACLAWIFSSRLKNGIIKIISAIIIMLFGFTPQIADWDSILSPESLSISLFVFSYSILVWLAFGHYDNSINKAKKIAGFVIFFITLFFWVFTRDVNTYSLIFLVFFILGLYIFPQFRKTKFLLFTSLIILSLAILGGITARQRSLWKLALTHVWVSDILPSPGNVQYFMDRGMPKYESPEYTKWFNKHAPVVYMQFLTAHPAYTIYKFFKDQNTAFEENMQPHFKANELKFRSILILIGDYMHPKSGAIFFVTLILLLILWYQFMFQKNQGAFPWIWLTTWAFLVTASTMFFSIFGDSWGLVRHALSSTTTYRLLMWMLLIIIADFSMVREENKLQEPGFVK